MTEQDIEKLYDKPLAWLTVREFVEILKTISPPVISNNVEEIKYLTVEEARKYLSVSTRTFQTYRNRRYFNFYQFGRKIYFLKRELDQFMQGHKIHKKR